MLYAFLTKSLYETEMFRRDYKLGAARAVYEYLEVKDDLERVKII